MSNHLIAKLLSKKALPLVLLSSLLLSGCGTIGNIMNPFEASFTCTGKEDEVMREDGSCSSIEASHAAALRQTARKPTPREDHGEETGDKKVKQIQLADTYKQATLKKMTNLLTAPTTPVVAPPTVLRILVLPYQDDDNGLNLMRYSYVMVDKPRWVLGDYLTESPDTP